MTLRVEAIYENGILKPASPLPLKEHEIVRLTIERVENWVQTTAGLIPCADPQLIDWVALDADLNYPPSPEER